MTIVFSRGKQPNLVMLVGESPGKEEASRGKPFVGKSGEEQAWYLSRHGLSDRSWYVTNVVKEYIPGNPDPTPEQTEEWTPVLENEIEECNPSLIIAVGLHAARWFLGDTVTMESSHGLPHRPGAFDSSRINRAPQGCTILPIYHPAFGFYDNDVKALIDWDYSQVAKVLDDIKRGRSIDYRVDPYRGREDYSDVTGEQLRKWLDSYPNKVILGLDTEGTTTNPATSIPWSIQLSASEGSGKLLRVEQPDFLVAIEAIIRKVYSGARFVIHHAMYDIEMCRKMGIDLFHADIWDTMYAAYLMRLEPQGLKPLAWRWCGMKMNSYEETIGDVGREKHLQYLSEVMSIDWPQVEPRLVYNNDGTSKMYKPQGISKSAEKIVLDIVMDKRNKDGEPTNPDDRWKKVLEKYDRETVDLINNKVGPMPVATLADIPLEDATYYACRDADAALRVYNKMKDELRNRE